MIGALLNAVVVASGGMLAIGPPLIVLILLSGDDGLPRAAAFFSGYAGGYVAIGCAALLVGSGVDVAGADARGVTDVMMIVLGALFFAFALKNLHAVITRKAPSPSGLMRSLGQMRPWKTALIGALISAINLKNLAIYLTAIAALSDAPAPLPAQLALVPVVALVFCVTASTPILARVAFPERSAAWLERMRSWLETHKRAIAVVVLTIFGGLFLYKGLT